MDWTWFGDFIDWWNPQRVSAAAAAIAATAAVVAATSSAVAATSAVRSFRQNRRDSKSKSRPMVAAELRMQPHVKSTQVLLIRNYGPSIARNVMVTFNPPIPDPADPSSSVTPFLKARYANPIAVLTPGMELDNIYFSGPPGQGNREPTPDQVTVTIRYQSDDGDEYSDDFPLDTNLIRNRTYSTSSGSPEEQVKVIAKSLKGLHDIAKRADRRNYHPSTLFLGHEVEGSDEPDQPDDATAKSVDRPAPLSHPRWWQRMLPSSSSRRPDSSG